MKIWIAKDWYATMAFLNKPTYAQNGEHKEWFGFRESAFERIIPQEIRDKIVEGEYIACEVNITEIK